MDLKLGINTGFAVNRFPEHEEWIRLTKSEFGLGTVQFTADMLNPCLPERIIGREIEKINENLKKYDVSIHSTFTGAFTRVNHLAHPDDSIRRYWVDWFKKFAAMSVELGAEAMGSHFGILSTRDFMDTKRKTRMLQKNIECWREIAAYAKDAGLKYLMWEPMSIGREYGETINAAIGIHAAVNENISLPMKICLDVDHGDCSAGNPLDTDPYAWIAALGKESPCIHLKQRTMDVFGHKPFTLEHNKEGIITPERIIRALDDAGVQRTVLLLELSFREREPYESNMIKDIKTSVEYWRGYVPD